MITMDCKDIQHYVAAFAEGELSPEIRAAMTEHMSGCESCSRLAEGYLAIESIIASEKAKEPNPFLATRILQKLENNNDQKSQPGILVLRRAVISLVLLAALVIGFFIGNYGMSRNSRISAGSNQIEVLRSDFYVHDFVDEDITLITTY